MALRGIKVIELAGLAPGPFAGMILADFGATVVRVDRPGQVTSSDILCRGKRSIVIDLKKASGRELLRKMIESSDIVIDPFRPGVMEKLGLGPDVFVGDGGSCKTLIYARIAGFSATSKFKDMAGHDLNYIALSGVLSLLPGERDPSFPLNLLADFAGGGAVCVVGILMALVSKERTGFGQVVQADMVSGSRYISAFPLLHSALQTPIWDKPRGQNTLDGGAPFYSLYRCADRSPGSPSGPIQYMSVACLEPQFFAEFISIFKRYVPLSLEDPLSRASDQDLQTNRWLWPLLRVYLREGFLEKSRDEWTKIFEGTDACAVPVLTPIEAATLSYGGNINPLPHPLLSTTPAFASNNISLLNPGEHTEEILQEYGIAREERRKLIESNVVQSRDSATAAKL